MGERVGFSEGRKTAQLRQPWNQKKRGVGHRVTPGALDRGRAVVLLLAWPAQAQGASMTPAALAKPSPALAANCTHQALRRALEQRGGGSKKPRAGLGSNPPLDWRKALDLLLACWSGPWNWRCQQKHANNTHTQHTHIVTQCTHTTHALSTLSPPRVPVQPAGGRQERGSEGLRPSIYRCLGDGGHSPLTERWNWTFFSGKTRRRDGTGKDTA